MKSQRGLEVSTSDPAVVQLLDVHTDRMLRMSMGAEEIVVAAQANPDEAALQLAAANAYLFGQTGPTEQAAATILQGIDSRALNPREQQWLQVLLAWQQRQYEQAATAFEQLTTQWPSDLLAVKTCEFIYYVLGQQYSGPRFLAHIDRLRPIHRDDPDFCAMDAFAHELCGDMAGAKQKAEAGLALQSRNPWAQHALEHVLLWEGNGDDAITLMRGWVSDWEASARPIHSHNSWHLSLALTDRLDFEGGFEFFDEHVWLKTPEVVTEQLDSIAFLWRAQLAGAEVDPQRWRELVPHIAQPARQLFMPFATAHYVYALAQAGETELLSEVLDRTLQRAGARDPEARRVWAPTGLGIVRAAAALGVGEAAQAASEFDAAMPTMTQIGGSDAQDDLFRFAYLDSLRRSGRKADARDYLTQRLARKPASPLEKALLRAS